MSWIKETSFALVVSILIFSVANVKIRECGKNFLSYLNSTFPSEYFKQKTMGVQPSLSLKALEKVYRCIKQLVGAVIRPNSTLKKLDFTQTNGRFREVLGKLDITSPVFLSHLKSSRTQSYMGFPKAPFFTWKGLCRPRNY